MVRVCFTGPVLPHSKALNDHHYEFETVSYRILKPTENVKINEAVFVLNVDGSLTEVQARKY